MKGILVIVSGPSGVGKGTVCKGLINKHTEIQLSISATTRPPRKGEVDGKNYFFISKEEFIDRINKGEFLEWAEVYGNYYGTPKDFVEKQLNLGKIVLLEIDIQGAAQVRKKVKNEGVFVFLIPPSMDELKNRIYKRGTDSQISIKNRLGSVREEMKQIKNYDYGIVNHSVEDTVQKVWNIIEAEKLKVFRLVDYIKELEGLS